MSYRISPKSLKIIIKYLNGTSSFNLWFLKVRESSLVVYFNLDLEDCISDRKDIGGSCHVFENYLVQWKSKKLNSVSLFMLRLNI